MMDVTLKRAWIKRRDHQWLLEEKKRSGKTIHGIITAALQRYKVQAKMERLALKRKLEKSRTGQ